MREYDKITEIILDESTGDHLPEEIEAERDRAINDLLAENEFRLTNETKETQGPYSLNLRVVENRLILEACVDNAQCAEIAILLTPFRRLMKDYNMVCDSYYKAVREASAQKIEALDMGRRGLHDEGANILLQHINDKAECDFPTARRLFTLMYILHLPSLR